MLKIAIQKNGRLTGDTIRLLGETGIYFQHGEKVLRTLARGMNLEIFFLRDDDIPEYVYSGVVHGGIVGWNTVLEKSANVEILKKLDFGHCRLSLAVPRDVNYEGLEYFRNKRIATSYPEILKKFFSEKNIPVFIEPIRGSVEISVSMGLADGIMDIVSTGSTLIMNGLREVETVLESSAVFIGTPGMDKTARKEIMELLFRLDSVMNAQKTRYIMLNAPKEKLEEIIRLIPGVKSPTIIPLAEQGWVSVHSVIQEESFWMVLQDLKNAGAQGILVIPIEKMVI